MNHNFGEKKTESVKGKELPVWIPPKYETSRAKAIEMIESNKYGLTDGDFWILMNSYANGTKMMYTGLIISHNGCLKINDALEDGFKAEYLNREWLNDSLIYEYNDGVLYEVGEVSSKNCMNSYPYAMAYKRCFDRVVLKKSKLAFSGIYSEVEADEFKEPMEEKTAMQKNGQAEKTDRWQGLQEDLNVKDLADEFRKLYSKEDQERILKGLKLNRAEDIGIVDLQKYVNFKKYGKK